MPTEAELIAERMRKIAALREQNINPYPYRFDRSTTIGEIRKKYPKLDPESRTGESVTIAGRLVGLRRIGKISFGQLQDGFGKLQIFLRKDVLGEQYDQFKLMDRGDFLGVRGEVIATKTGELTVDITEFTVLSKAMRPLPDKWGGLKDIEARYRRRYLDLIMNPDVATTFQKRAEIIKVVREVLDGHGFLEVDTPVLQPIYGGGNAKPFVTTLNALKMKAYLRIANELYLKRLIVGGIERVYEIARDFRNEDIDRTHNPEFSMVEMYQSYGDLSDMMEITEEIVATACERVNGTLQITFGEHELNFTRPWKRMTMVEAIKRYGKIDVMQLSQEELFDLRTTYNLDIPGNVTKGKIIQALFEELAEPHLIQPTFITEHPQETTPFAKVSRNHPDFVERFELFVAGKELANAYSELNDPVVQRRLLEEQSNDLRAGNDEAHPMDEDFVRAIEHGMPPCGGNGIGIDRLIMILTNNASIRDVLFFPFMKVEE